MRHPASQVLRDRARQRTAHISLRRRAWVRDTSGRPGASSAPVTRSSAGRSGWASSWRRPRWVRRSARPPIRRRAVARRPDLRGHRAARRPGRRPARPELPAEQPRPVPAHRQLHGHPAVDEHRDPGPHARAGRVQSARRAAKRHGHSAAGGRGRGRAGRQSLPARLPRENGHLPRRRPRHRPVQPRRLQPRAGRRAQGTVRRLLRPRLDGRRHQPGEQVTTSSELLRRDAERRQRAAGSRHHRLEPGAGRHQHGPAPQRARAVQRARRPRLRGHPPVRRGAVVCLGHRHADPGDGELLLLLREQSAGPRYPDRHVPRPDRRAARREPVELLRHRAAGLREGAPAPRHHHLRPQVQRGHRVPQHLPLPMVGSGGRRHAGRHPPARHRRAAAGVDRSHQEPRGPRRERVDPRQPDRSPVQVQHVDAQAQAGGRRRPRPSNVRPPDHHAHAGAEHVAHEPGSPFPPGHLHLDEGRAVRGGRLVGRAPTSWTTSRSCRGSRSWQACATTTSTPTSRTSMPTAPSPRSSAVWTSSGRPAPRSSCSRRPRRRTTSPGGARSTRPPSSSTRSTSPTRAPTPSRATRTSWAARSASSTMRSA